MRKMKSIKILIILISGILTFSSCNTSNKEQSDLEASNKQSSATNAGSNKSIKVRVQNLFKEKVDHTIRATGIADAEQIAFISPETNGLIKKIHVREGQYVTKGTLLISLSSTILQNSKNELEKALELAEIMYEKQEMLQNKGVGKEIDFLQAKNKKESLQAKLKTLNSQLAMSQIRAPFSGTVDRINAKQGEMASPAAPLIQMVNLSVMSVTADIAEKYIAVVQKGKKVLVTFSAYPDLKIETKITRTGNIINPVNRTFEVETGFKNKNKKIKPNMVCELNITDYSGEEILVPSNVVRNDRKGQFVYIVKEENGLKKAHKQYIKTSFISGSKTVVKEGLTTNDILITEGGNMVSNGIQITIIK